MYLIFHNFLAVIYWFQAQILHKMTTDMKKKHHLIGKSEEYWRSLFALYTDRDLPGENHNAFFILYNSATGAGIYVNPRISQPIAGYLYKFMSGRKKTSRTDKAKSRSRLLFKSPTRATHEVCGE